MPVSAEIKAHLLYPGLVFLLLAGLVETSLWDITVADYLYHIEGGSWSLRNNFFASTIMHKAGRSTVEVMVICLLGMTLYHLWKRNVLVHRAGIYLLTSFIITTLVISGLKQLTHVSCPWELARYGGGFPYFPIFSMLPHGASHGECFPAGHASAGYAWVALYYYFSSVSEKYRWHGLIFGLLFGLGFDIAQQLRGAHFVSHGLWTLGISWLIATGLYFTVFKTYIQGEQEITLLSSSFVRGLGDSRG